MSPALNVTQAKRACPEHELVAAVRQGDERAFEELYSRYATRIGAYIFATVGDHGRAEDIAQEVFISALRRLRATEHPIAFRPWLYEIAKNACIDEFRRTRRTQQVSLDDEHPAQGSQAMVSSAPSPDAAVESKQQLDDLCGAFGGLSQTHHRIIVLRELEGLSYAQIGDRLGMSRAGVESTLFRARRRLSEEYEELVSGRRCQQVQLVIDNANERTVRRFGVRQRRQLARHLAHCQPCRHHARMAGLAESLLAPPSLAGKIAALLPIPWLRWRRAGSHATAASSPHAALSAQTLQTVARFAEPAAPAAVGLGRAAVTVAAVVMAGVGGGLVTGLSPHHVPSTMVGFADRGPDGSRSAATSPVRGRLSSSTVAGAASGSGSATRAGGAGPRAGSASSSTSRGGSGASARGANSLAAATGGGAGTTSPGSASGAGGPAGGGPGSAGGGPGSAGAGAGSAGGAVGAQTPTGAAGSAAGGSTNSTPTGPLGALSTGALGAAAPAAVGTVTGALNPVLNALPPIGLPSVPPVSTPPVPQVPALPHLGLGRLLH
ncbi:MAG: RNA polymerase sigma factor [Solirubrobacteraceae bacterium]